MSFTYWTTAHKCACGCGQKVVLRLSPKHWAITLNGESVSMYPSVGNWQLPCRSHYWIEEGRIIPARRWSDSEILRNREITKGNRTPFQTPLAYLRNDSELEDCSDTLTRKESQNPRCNTAKETHKAEGRVIVSVRKGEENGNSVSTGWLNRAKTRIHRGWRIAKKRIVDPRPF